ncbi:gtp-binding protein brassinazole insensitive pale green 2 [Quercus suber]|uniref:Gtp-binding protein brassinazole insensitive pale green 2 n=1 Tax=Quercus suber TaxID=58331 RepID=A0AAW0JUN0_QUESU
MESRICARCHTLRHYGNVKDPTVENLLPDFDFDHTVGRRLALTGGMQSVVLMVVDATDFDGSFLRKVARLVSEKIGKNSKVLKQGKSGNLPRMVMEVTKIDLLPTELSPTRRRRREDCTFDRGASARDYIRVEGKLFDTPGLLHPHQITTRLTREEQKLVHISKELRPRTYKIKRYSIGCYLKLQLGVALPTYR